MKLTGRNGVLRILDSTDILHGTAPLDGITPSVFKCTSGGVWTDNTAALITLNGAGVNDIIGASGSKMLVGSTVKFARVLYQKGVLSDYAAGAGAMITAYFNGSNFTAMSETDGTADGANCLAQDGYVSFPIPRNWVVGANAFYNALDADKYYMLIQAPNNPDPDPDADVLCPVGEQYFEVAFSAMDFSGPLGRKLQEELLVLDRNTMGARGHYIKGPDGVLYEPVPISFSCMLDDTYNKDDIMEALACGDPDSTYWTATGTSSKGDTKNDGSISNPAFVDTNKKCVNLQVLWTGSYPIGMAYYECYFPPDEITIAESEDGITLSAAGGCYGVIETIHGFGNRY